MTRISALILALLLNTQVSAALDNPFDKTEKVLVPSDVAWKYSTGAADRTASSPDGDGNFYRLVLSAREIALHVVSSAAGAERVSFEQFAVEDLRIDGETAPLFSWCLKNQERHDRFLQQGLSVNKSVCQNKGASGEFTMKLNQATYEQLLKATNVVFRIKPYRQAVEVEFELVDMSNVFAEIAGTGKKAKSAVAKQKYLSQPAGSVPVAGKVVIEPCEMTAPPGFPSVKPVKYVCDDAADKTKARNDIAAAVKKEKDRRLAAARALEREKQEKARAEAERLKKEAERKKEQEAILAIEANTNKIRSQVTERMVAMCKKTWSDGEHRCYCEPYLEFAPAGIVSDPSCAAE